MDQTYVNLFILISIVVLVMFLWRKLIILEGNFFILEKRVNLIKKDAREDSISRNIEKSDVIMNEIFKDYSPSNACKNFECPLSAIAKIHSENLTDNLTDNLTINEDMVKYISEQSLANLKDTDKLHIDVSNPDVDIITFNKGGNADTDVTGVTSVTGVTGVTGEASDTGEDADIDKIIDTNDANEQDNASVCSEITFTSDDKKSDKTLLNKYSKMSLEKLKEICRLNNIIFEGTRKQLISRIIENSK